MNRLFQEDETAVVKISAWYIQGMQDIVSEYIICGPSASKFDADEQLQQKPTWGVTPLSEQQKTESTIYLVSSK